MTNTIKHRRDTAANWTSQNPILNAGEMGLETDTLKVKYGDGSTVWNSLSYPAGGSGATSIDGLTDGIANATSVYLGTASGGSVTNAVNNTTIGINALAAVTTGGYNVAIGYDTLKIMVTGAGNTAVGNQALDSATAGNFNTAIGQNALQSSTTASNNTAVGKSAMNACTTGTQNAAFGKEALSGTIGTSDNTAVGYQALGWATGASNTAVGCQTLLLNTGTNNTAVGVESMKAALAGAHNSCVGYRTLQLLTTGTHNVAMGYTAGGGITTGTYNVCLGAGTTISAGATKRIAIGYGVNNLVDNSWIVGPIGSKQYIYEGANAAMGLATLVAGTVTVANTLVTANSRIFITAQADGGTPGSLRVSARAVGTNFVITSSSGADTSTVAWEIKEPR